MRDSTLYPNIMLLKKTWYNIRQMMLLFWMLTTLYSHSSSEDMSSSSELFRLINVHRPDTHVQKDTNETLYKSIEAMCFALTTRQDTNPSGEASRRKRKAETSLEEHWQSKTSKTLSAAHVHSEGALSIPEPNSTSPHARHDHTYPHAQEQEPDDQRENLISVLSSGCASNELDAPIKIDLNDSAKVEELLSLLLEEGREQLSSPNGADFNFSHTTPTVSNQPPLTLQGSLTQTNTPECLHPQPQDTTITTLFLTTKADQILQNPTEMEPLIHSIYQTAELSDPAPSSIAEMLNSILTKFPPIKKNDETRFCIQAISEICTFLLSLPPLDNQLLSEVRETYFLRDFPHLTQRTQSYKNIFFIRTTTKLTYSLQTLREHLTPTNQTLKQILQMLKINDTQSYTALKQCSDFLKKNTLHPQLHLPCFANPATALCNSLHRKIESVIKILQETESPLSFDDSYHPSTSECLSVSAIELNKKAEHILQNPKEMKETVHSIYQSVGYRDSDPSPISEMLFLIHQEIPDKRKYDDARFCINTLTELCSFHLAQPPLDLQLLDEIQHQYRNTSFSRANKRSRVYHKMFFQRTITKLTYALQTLRENLTPSSSPLTKILATLSIDDSCACTALDQCASFLRNNASHPQLEYPLVKDSAADLCLSTKIKFALMIQCIKMAESQNNTTLEHLS